ncbi:type II secretion system F family protein [Candidatus Kuenenbacteria bacterium]|nr:type II secretion system F family protein [Candidatus Kuenenbacteria bacterium]
MPAPRKKQKRYRFAYFGLKNKAYGLIENLSNFIGAGLDIKTALSSMREEEPNTRINNLLKRISDDIDEGLSLADSLEKQNFLDQYTISFIRLGEKSGKLVDNLKLIVLQREKERIFRSKLNSSLLYIVIIFLLTIFVGVGTAWYTLPKVAGVYKDLGANLPLLTIMIIKVGMFFSDYGYFIVPVFMLLILATFYFLFSFPKTKFIGHLILFRIPFISKLIKYVEISRSSYLLGYMLSAGLTISSSLESMPGTTTFNNYKKFYAFLGAKVEEGNSLQKSISSYPKVKKLLTPDVRQMLYAAEKSGTLADTLLKIGVIYENRAETVAKNLPIILEPLFLILVGFGVLLFVLGTMVPIYNFSSII